MTTTEEGDDGDNREVHDDDNIEDGDGDDRGVAR